MMHELYHYGPLVATMVVYEDLLNFTGDGVYQQNSDKAVGAHAVKIIGWGAQEDEVAGVDGNSESTSVVPYWIVQNSWTARYGYIS
jgi:cathepsin B